MFFKKENLKEIKRRSAELDEAQRLFAQEKREHELLLDLKERNAELKIQNIINRDRIDFYEEEMRRIKESINGMISLFSSTTVLLWKGMVNNQEGRIENKTNENKTQNPGPVAEKE